MGIMEWCWTNHPEPQPLWWSGWLEACGRIRCIDPVLTLPNQGEDFWLRELVRPAGA